MKYLKFVVLFMLLGNVAFAQKDPEAKKMLDAIAKKALGQKSIVADFEYELYFPNDKGSENYKGNVVIKGHKYKLSIDETLTLCDGKTRWVYLQESNEVNVSDVVIEEGLEPEERFLSDPISLFTIHKEGFKYGIEGTEKIGDKTYTLIDLSPEDLNKSFFKIRYWVTESNDLYRIKYFQKDGTRMTLFLENMELNSRVKDGDFVFDPSKYPNVEIIDIRE